MVISDRRRNQVANTTLKGRIKDKLYKWKPGMDHCQYAMFNFETTLG